MFCVGAAAKMETRGQLRAKWTDLQTSVKDGKGTALFSYCASALQGAKFIFRALQCVQKRNKG